MIVEDQLDRCIGRISGVEELEEFDEFAAAIAILDQGVNLAGDEKRRCTCMSSTISTLRI